MFVSDRRLYLTKDGEVVEEGDERAATLLLGVGGTMEDEAAANFGLTNKPSKKAVTEAPDNKAVTEAPETK